MNDAQAVAIIAAIFQSTDLVCANLSDLDNSISRGRSHGYWARESMEESIARARALLAATRDGPTGEKP